MVQACIVFEYKASDRCDVEVVKRDRAYIIHHGILICHQWFLSPWRMTDVDRSQSDSSSLLRLERSAISLRIQSSGVVWESRWPSWAPVPNKPTVSVDVKQHSTNLKIHIVQELCESRGGRPGLSILTSLVVSVYVKLYWTMLRHWSQLVPNMSTDIRGH